MKRPAGNVLFVADAPDYNLVRQLLVIPGVNSEGWVEIPEGLKPGITVVVEGAQYLSDGAGISVQESAR